MRRPVASHPVVVPDPHTRAFLLRGWARTRYAAVTLVAGCVIAACGPEATVQPESPLIDDAALASDPSGTEWRAYGRTTDQQRFSPLDQIKDSNVANLSVDWFIELPTDKSLVSTPLVVDGVLYFVGSMNVVRAVDATSGDLLWEYDPRVRDHARRMQAGWDQSRGIAYYKGRVYAATWDGRLNAIDAETGEEVWSAMTVDPEDPLYITGAPLVFKDKVLIGNGGTEKGPMRGYVTAYHADTGEQAWRFWIVPGNPADGFENEAMEMAAKTWTGEWWVHGGGGNAWHGFTYDAELDQLYIGTGNGSPWNRKIRSPGGGDNLFLCSVVALDPDTGTYLWHVQQSPGETWDYNSNMDIVLADLEIEGRMRKVILHAPKTGFFYVIDRADGTVISAEPFTTTTWATHIDLETGRPVEVPGARYEDGEAEVTPGPTGAHSWHAMSFNPRTGLAYYPAIHWNWRYSDSDLDLETWRSEPWIGGTGVSWEMLGPTRPDSAYSTLQAWDPVRQELVWEVPQPGKFSPGTLTTAGNLVFQGRVDGTLVAYAADTGKELWQVPLGLGVSAPPISYSVDGRQYIALLVGWGGALAGLGGASVAEYGWAYGAQTRMLVAFSLEGTVLIPPRADPIVPTPVEAEFTVDTGLAEAGAETFGRCVSCHGPGAIAAGMAPDLRASLLIQSAEAFAEVVRDGARAPNGMPIFPELTDEDLLELRNYIRQQAEAGLNQAEGGEAD